jgi:hypothetical protein
MAPNPPPAGSSSAFHNFQVHIPHSPINSSRNAPSSPAFFDLESKTAALKLINTSVTMQAPSDSLFPFPSPPPSHPLYSQSQTDETPSLGLNGMAKSMNDIEMESYDIRDGVRTKRQADTQTQQTYSRYVAAYQKWWETDQWLRVQRDPTYTAISPFPILASKVVLFLNFETSREKVS